MSRSFIRGSAARRTYHRFGDSTNSGSSGEIRSGSLLSNIPFRHLVAFDDAHGGRSLSEAELLELCDVARASLAKGNTTETIIQRVAHDLLKDAVKDETQGISTIELPTVRNARIDTLLVDILSPEKHAAASRTQPWKNLIPTAERLQRQWRARFGEKYFDLDQTRLSSLTKTGQLRDVAFDNRTDDVNHQLWQTRPCEALSEGEGNLQYETGYWWLNIACAHRDGIVGSADERPTKGVYSVTTLPLLSGREEVASPSETVEYIREGELSDMHLSLISQVGTQIRILRGYCLRSPLAPKAGLRYDGLYTIRQYGQKLCPKSGLHRLVLTLVRVPGQRPLADLAMIPRPSQMDDWLLFEKYEGEMVRQSRGNQGFLDWKTAKAEGNLELEQWKRALELSTELGLTRTRQSCPPVLSDTEDTNATSSLRE